MLLMILRLVLELGRDIPTRQDENFWSELRSPDQKVSHVRVIHVKEESLLAEKLASLPANKRFFLIVYKMLVLGLGRRSGAPLLPGLDQHFNHDENEESMLGRCVCVVRARLLTAPPQPSPLRKINSSFRKVPFWSDPL